MKDIVFIILFIVPGVLVERFYERLYPSSVDRRSNYRRLTEIIISSTIVLVLNLIIMKVYFGRELTTFEDFKLKLESIYFMCKYILLTIPTSIIVMYLSDKYYEHVEQNIVNLLRKSKGLSTENLESSVWEGIFENPDYKLYNSIIVIEKDNELIDQGVLYKYSSPLEISKTFELWHGDLVKEVYLKEMSTEFKDRVYFKKQKSSYSDVDNGTVVKIYNGEKLIEEVINTN